MNKFAKVQRPTGTHKFGSHTEFWEVRKGFDGYAKDCEQGED